MRNPVLRQQLKEHTWGQAQVLMHSAATLGVDTCPMEGFDRDKVNELLQLPQQGYAAVVLCAAGYRTDDDKYAALAQVRYAPETVIGYYD